MRARANRSLPVGLWADMVLAVTESHLPVLPLPLDGGEGEERGEGLCCEIQWATAKPGNRAATNDISAQCCHLKLQHHGEQVILLRLKKKFGGGFCPETAADNNSQWEENTNWQRFNWHLTTDRGYRGQHFQKQHRSGDSQELLHYKKKTTIKFLLWILVISEVTTIRFFTDYYNLTHTV